MKTLLTILFLSIGLSNNLSAYEIIKKMNDKEKPVDLKSTLTMDSIESNGEKRTSVFKSWVKNDGEKQLIWFLEPLAYKGISFLKTEKEQDTDMKMWVPKFKKVRKISSNNKGDSFMNSDLTFEDLYIREIDDYSYQFLREEKYTNKDCYLIESTSKNLENSNYLKHQTWISKKDLLPLKEISYDKNGAPDKQKEIEYIKKDGKDIVSSIKIKNLKEEHYTNLYVNDVVLNSDIKDSYFKEHRLKRIPN